MKASLATLLLLSLCSCHYPATCGWSLRAPDPLPAEGADTRTAGPNRIAVGDAMDEVGRRIAAAGGTDIRGSVGIIDYPLSSWYRLRDGTCLQVTPAAMDGPGSEVVGQLMLGKPGRGYGNWENWERQRPRELGYVDLR